ncbi:MAG: class I SAM-dependent methyltransferase [Vicinamibacteraceae bacterium]
METQPTPACCACGRRGLLAYTDLDDALFGTEGRWTLRRCPNRECGMLWLDPQPTPHDIGEAYARYYTHGGCNGEAGISPARRVFRFGYRHVFTPFVAAYAGVLQERRRLERLAVSGRRGRLLDVGCGDGSRLARLRREGWDVHGLDVDPVSARRARERYGLDVQLGPLETAPYEQGSFDTIISSHVIEHVHEPLAVLRQAHRLLKAGGRLVAVTPNVASLGHARYIEHWLGLDPPRHLHLFSPASLEALARAAGFTEVDVRTTPAWAQSMARMSLHIADHRAQRRLTWRDRLARELEAVRFQREAARLHRRNPQSGEECVLQATK